MEKCKFETADVSDIVNSSSETTEAILSNCKTNIIFSDINETKPPVVVQDPKQEGINNKHLRSNP